MDIKGHSEFYIHLLLKLSPSKYKMLYQQIIKIAQGVNSEYTKIDDIPLNEPYKILSFEWKVTQYGSKVIAHLENNKWFYLPQRIVKYLNREDPYLAIMNDKNWTLIFKGRESPKGFAILELSYS